MCTGVFELVSVSSKADGDFGFSDSDWAGCTRTRKSTSGGCILIGNHLIQHDSSTQQNVALSSAEAELNSATKMISEGLGVKHMLEDIGIELDLEVSLDSSAAKGI